MTEADSQLQEVLARAQALYGGLSAPLSGAIHTVAAVRGGPAGSRLRVIKIQAGAPQSSTDAFVLRFWRAHYDAILTTGQVLRAEPLLSYAPSGSLRQGLMRYRAQILGKARPQRCAIMTRGPSLPVDHPVFHDGHAELELLVLTDPQHARSLQRSLAGRAQVIAVAELDARSALGVLQRMGAAAIGIEAGPSVAGTLYTAPSAVDHLMLSICEASVDPAVVGGELPADAQLFAGLRLMSDVARAEQSGPWRFQRWQRADLVEPERRCAAVLANGLAFAAPRST